MSKNYDTLIISGASTSGLVILGKLFQLHYFKGVDLKCIKNYGGSSIGALISFFLILGYMPHEILSHIIRNNIMDIFNKVNVSNLILMNLYSLGKLKEKIIDIIGIKNSSLRFCDVEKNFLCNSFNLDRQQYVCFSKETTPNHNILDCVMTSCAIPFLFEPILLEGERFIDGGLINNFPVLDTLKYFKCNKTLGIVCIKKYRNEKTDKKYWSIYDIIPVLMANITWSCEVEISQTKDFVDIVRVYSDLPFYQMKLKNEECIKMFCFGFV